MILSKVYQVAPWKAAFVKSARWIDKYTFPLKFFFHILLIILGCSLLSCDNYQWGSYQRSASAFSCRFFYPLQQCDLDQCLGALNSITPSLDSFSCTLYQRDYTKTAIADAIGHYYILPNTSLAVVDILDKPLSAGTSCVPNANSYQASLTVSHLSGEDSQYTLEEVAMDQFALLDTLLNNSALVQTKTIIMRLPVYDYLITDVQHGRILWIYKVIYSFDSQVQFSIQVNPYIAQVCGDLSYKEATKSLPSAQFKTSLHSLQPIVIILAQIIIVLSILYLLLLLREVVDNMRLYYYAVDLFTITTATTLSKSRDSDSSNSEEKNEIAWWWKCLRMIFFVPPVHSGSHGHHTVVEESSSNNPNNPKQQQQQQQHAIFLAPAALYGDPSTASVETPGEIGIRRIIKEWPKIQMKIKTRIFDGWRLLALVALLCNIAAASLWLRPEKAYYLVFFDGLNKDGNRLLLGVATALLCFSMLNYFRYSNRFLASGLVLWGAFFKVQRLLVSIFPLAIGMLFLGLMLFGRSSSSFGDFGSIVVTIFSVMNCDSVWQTFVDTNGSQLPKALGTVYVTFIFIIFSYFLLRVILATVESLYFYLRLYTSARRKRTQFRRMALNTALESSSSRTSRLTQISIRVKRHSSEELRHDLLKVYALHQRQQHQQEEQEERQVNHGERREDEDRTDEQSSLIGELNRVSS
eukprot:gene9088-10031_t